MHKILTPILIFGLSTTALFASNISTQQNDSYSVKPSNSPIIKISIPGIDTYLSGNYAYTGECAGYIRDPRVGYWVVQNKCTQRFRFGTYFYRGLYVPTKHCLAYGQADVLVPASIQTTYPTRVVQTPC